MRRSGDSADRAKPARSLANEPALHTKDLSPAKRRIAEALAALLLADFQRQGERADLRRDPRS
jgi:hypothetical protein